MSQFSARMFKSGKSLRLISASVIEKAKPDNVNVHRAAAKVIVSNAAPCATYCYPASVVVKRDTPLGLGHIAKPKYQKTLI